MFRQPYALLYKGKANETRNKRAASKTPGRGQNKAKKAVPGKKETEAARAVLV
jgi:hypothetical protein